MRTDLLIQRRFREVINHAKQMGGECLSTEYNPEKIIFVCSKGHQWEMNPYDLIRKKKWCPVCHVRRRKGKYTSKDLRRIAEERGGKCLSEYEGYFVNNEWECAKGHRWMATPHSVLNKGSWCRTCYFEERKGHPRNKESNY